MVALPRQVVDCMVVAVEDHTVDRYLMWEVYLNPLHMTDTLSCLVVGIVPALVDTVQAVLLVHIVHLHHTDCNHLAVLGMEHLYAVPVRYFVTEAVAFVEEYYNLVVFRVDSYLDSLDNHPLMYRLHQVLETSLVNLKNPLAMELKLLSLVSS